MVRLERYLDGAELRGEVLRQPLHRTASQVRGQLRPGIGGDVDAAAIVEPMLAAISLSAVSSCDPGTEMPFMPPMSYTSSSTGTTLPFIGNGTDGQFHTLPVDACVAVSTVLAGIYMLPTSIGSSRRISAPCRRLL